MKKRSLFMLALAGNLLATMPAQADYIAKISYKVMHYDLAGLNIPATVGEVGNNWHDDSSITTQTNTSNDVDSYIELSINGTLLGDGVTWATSNPGIGIQYKLSPNSLLGFSPSASTEAPNYHMVLKRTSDDWTTSYIHLYYRFVRLLEKVPAGKITSVPDVTLLAYNPGGHGDAMSSGLILSGISTQPKVVACNIDGPTQIKLPTLYGASITNGAQNIVEAPTIKLTNCPGAIDGISYNFDASYYGTQNAANGVLKTASGDGYAKNVYIQLQNADGSPLQAINTLTPLSNYDGSGDYVLPAFKVGYFINDANKVTAGTVKTAIELKVTYN